MFPPLILSGVIVLACLGCEGPHTNPSFPLTVKEAKAALEEMEADAKPLDRPLILVAGYGDPGFVDGYLEKRFKPCLLDERIVRADFRDSKTFAGCREHLVEVIDQSFPSSDPDRTIEVDIVANSMGGLIAAYAAAPDVEGRRVNVARLFAISAPFGGAKMAEVPTGDQILIDMRPGSEFVLEMKERIEKADYELIPYARLGDQWVGIEHTGPAGQAPWWVPNRAFNPAHLSAFTDPRFHADILRRLRGETPYTTEPRTPLPEPTTERAPPTPKP